MTREFLAFVLAGGVAAAANWLSRMALEPSLGLLSAVVVAYLIGMTTAFVLTKLFVFAPSRREIRHEYGRFALVNVLALAQVLVVTVVLARHVLPYFGIGNQAGNIAHAIGVVSPVITSYFGHRYFTFAKKT